MPNINGGQGRRFSKAKIDKIKYLLAETEMTVPQIAERMGCSQGPILKINRQFGIRIYDHRRKMWHKRNTDVEIDTTDICYRR